MYCIDLNKWWNNVDAPSLHHTLKRYNQYNEHFIEEEIPWITIKGKLNNLFNIIFLKGDNLKKLKKLLNYINKKTSNITLYNVNYVLDVIKCMPKKNFVGNYNAEWNPNNIIYLK